MKQLITKSIYLVTGWVALLTAIVGIFLPLIPTTPLLLLAAFCFSRSSSRLHQWLLSHKTLGPIIDRWHRTGTIDRSIKIKAIALLAVSFAITLFFAPVGMLGKALLLSLGLSIAYYLASLPETEALVKSDDD